MARAASMLVLISNHFVRHVLSLSVSSCVQFRPELASVLQGLSRGEGAGGAAGGPNVSFEAVVLKFFADGASMASGDKLLEVYGQLPDLPKQVLDVMAGESTSKPHEGGGGG